MQEEFKYLEDGSGLISEIVSTGAEFLEGSAHFRCCEHVKLNDQPWLHHSIENDLKEGHLVARTNGKGLISLRTRQIDGFLKLKFPNIRRFAIAGCSTFFSFSACRLTLFGMSLVTIHSDHWLLWYGLL